MTIYFDGISFSRWRKTRIKQAHFNDKALWETLLYCGNHPWKIVKLVQVADNVVIVVLHMVCNLWEELCPKASFVRFLTYSRRD